MKRSVTFIARETPFNAHALNVLLGSLEKYFSPEWCDLKYGRNTEEITGHALQSHAEGRIPVIAWSFHSAEANRVRQEAGDVRRRLDLIPAVFIAGGAHATARPEESMDMGFDTVFRGEGERLITEYVHELIRCEDIREMRGIRNSPPGEKIDLDDYPAFPEKTLKLNPVEITRGCVYACRFCQTSYLFGGAFRHRSADSILKYAKILTDRGGHFLRMTTPSAFSYGSSGKEPSPDKVETLLRELREVMGPDRKIYFGTFPSEIRPEHVTKESLQIIKRYADNDNIILGVQSGSERILERCHRECAPATALRAVELALDTGFSVNADMIFGLPGEEKSDRLETIRLIQKMAKPGVKIHAHWFMPLPGTPFEHESPAPPDPWLLSELDTLTTRKILYGQWRKQLHQNSLNQPD